MDEDSVHNGKLRGYEKFKKVKHTFGNMMDIWEVCMPNFSAAN